MSPKPNLKYVQNAFYSQSFLFRYKDLKRSKIRGTKLCSKLKRSEIKQARKKFVSTLEHVQVPKWDRARRSEVKASSIGMPHPL